VVQQSRLARRGSLTMEDCARREIVGEILDEYDEPEI